MSCKVVCAPGEMPLECDGPEDCSNGLACCGPFNAAFFPTGSNVPAASPAGPVFRLRVGPTICGGGCVLSEFCHADGDCPSDLRCQRCAYVPGEPEDRLLDYGLCVAAEGQAPPTNYACADDREYRICTVVEQRCF